MTAALVRPRRLTLAEGLAWRVGAALLAWAERPRGTRADVDRLIAHAHRRTDAVAADYSGLRP